MVIGADPVDTAAVWDQYAAPMRAAAAANAAAAAAAAPPPITGALVGLVVPGAIVTLVRRQNHPFIWWAFGAIPMAWSAARLVLAVGSKVEKK